MPGERNDRGGATSAARLVIIGIEFGGFAEAFVGWVARVWAPRSELVLVHAVDVADPPDFLRDRLPGGTDAIDAATAGAERRLRDLAVPFEGRARAIVRVGRPASVLADLAREVGADELVIGEHGARKGRIELLGSTAENLLHLADLPVLVLRDPPPSPPDTVLVAVDQSAGEGVLQHAAAIARHGSASIVVLHVLGAGIVGRVGLISTDRSTDEFERGLIESTRRWLADQASAAGLDTDRTVLHVTFGKAANEILAAVERLENPMIVMGSRGAGGFGRLMLGSVARTVTRTAACPVLVVPTG